MLHPDTELRYIDAAIGYGVFATAPIPCGTITWVRDDLDQAFSPDQVSAMPALYTGVLEKYCFRDSSGDWILCWDLARYLNHSCDPTCLSAGYDFEIAVRDIAPGEELTDDYATLNPEEPFACLCGAENCRRMIRPEDAERLAEEWDYRVRRVFPRVGQTPQPLWAFVREAEEVEAALRTGEVASCRRHLLPVTRPLAAR